jgi:hypothetical protein
MREAARQLKHATMLKKRIALSWYAATDFLVDSEADSKCKIERFPPTAHQGNRVKHL